MPREARTMAAADASIDALIAQKRRYLVPMALASFVGYIGLTVLAGFAKDVLAIKVAGGFNLGFLLIACNYVLSWVLAVLYVRIANNVFDPAARNIANRTSSTGVSA